LPDATSNPFVAEFDPNKSGAASLEYATYLGGTGASATVLIVVESFTIALGDVGTGIAVNTTTGDVWVTGLTASTDFRNIPGTVGTPFQSTNQANANAGPPATALFITQLNPKAAGAAQVRYSTYFSGKGTKLTPPFGSGNLGFGDAP